MAYPYSAFLPAPPPFCFTERSPDALPSSSRLPYPTPHRAVPTSLPSAYTWCPVSHIPVAPSQRPVDITPRPYAPPIAVPTPPAMPAPPPRADLPALTVPPARPPSAGSSDERPSPPPVRVREKRHGCWMCHKSFDRPSTLKKHLLVHTGEKAYACDTCGRRFGVASNLNRHARKCVLRTVHAPAARADVAQAPGASASASSSTSDPPAHNASPAPAASSPADAARSSPASEPEGAVRRARTTTVEAAGATSAGARPKRRRRAPSPAPWIPPSLLRFDITPLTTLCAVPLAPVHPYRDAAFVEERNSYEENTPYNPYHPEGWKGRLPGPGLLGASMLNTSMRVGQLLSF